jgi:hypothetical protein
MIIDTKYNLGDIVFLKTDKDQVERMIVEILVKGQYHLCYQLACGIGCSWHSDFEFDSEISIITKIKNR